MWKRKTTALAVFAAMLQAGCNRAKTPPAGEATETASLQPGLFSVRSDQIAHLKVATAQRSSWSTTIRTTGTVDWDADHTTQAISQVNGPISRILVDKTYTPNLGFGDFGGLIVLVAGAIIFYVARAYRRSKGVNIDQRYKEIPIE